MMYNVLGGNPRTDHISIWLSFTCNGRLMYTPVLDDVSLENGLGMVKHEFQSMLELFVKRDTYSYEMDSRRSLENVGGTGEGAVMVYGGQAPAEGDEIVERPIVEFIPEERELSGDAIDNSSGEESWPDLIREEVEEKEDVELPLPTMGVPPLEENDAPYPDPWIGVMDMDVTYRNTMVPGVDDDNVPPPVGVGVGQRFMTKDALVMYLKDYCISRHVQFRVHKSGPTIYSVHCTGDQCPWHVYASFSMKLNMWKIRRCNDEHTCLNAELSMDNRLCTSRVICNLIMPNVRTSFTLSPYEIIQLVEDKYHIQRTSIRGLGLYHVWGVRWLEGGLRCTSSLTVTLVYHPRGYTEEALLGCVRNVVERVNHRATLYPSSTDPHWLEIEHYCQSVLHSLPLLEGAIISGDVSHAAETTTRVEDSDEVPAVPEPTVLDLPPEQTPDTEPSPPLEQPLEQPQEEPNRHPPFRKIYTRRHKKAIGAPEPSSAL
ncbi:hypothetical protein H6P81_012628 [Aristolochia fimbriata]|uniref:Transposase MuDR plant domain-containing protein n=1 Tax=Aristolochia fimbriata TaxID=158543 RepID=A0AAV7EEH4_ARIFI|nr:hypothetical protein H6P81_012628 [Aristolochia fimbriata]